MQRLVPPRDRLIPLFVRGAGHSYPSAPPLLPVSTSEIMTPSGARSAATCTQAQSGHAAQVGEGPLRRQRRPSTGQRHESRRLIATCARGCTCGAYRLPSMQHVAPLLPAAGTGAPTLRPPHLAVRRVLDGAVHGGACLQAAHQRGLQVVHIKGQHRGVAGGAVGLAATRGREGEGRRRARRRVTAAPLPHSKSWHSLLLRPLH